MQQDALLSLDSMEKNITAAKLPLHLRYAAFGKDVYHDKSAILSFMHLYLESMTTSANAMERDLACIANLRCAETALAIERYRRKHNTIPDSLEKLVPQYLEAVPRDPFDNEHLRYIKLDNGFKIYSIGQDSQDNGGISRKETYKISEKKMPFDWPFTVKWQ